MKNLLLLLTLIPFIVSAQRGNQIDSEVRKMTKEVSADSIKKYIAAMAGFETRHSLSDTLSQTRGIGAARRWVAGKFKQFARDNKANMKVVLDPFEVKPNPRNPRVNRVVTMKNVLATLPGTDPNDNRVLLVSGHLDSRNSDAMDSVGAAPGANDDASGVAVVLELARVMSKRKFPCTIIFMAVQGEEQGLLGARHMAGKLKEQNVNLVAMFNNDIVGNTKASETGSKEDRTVRIFSEMIPSLETDEQSSARKTMRAENDSPSRQLARYIKEVSEPYFEDFFATLSARPDRFLRGGDHTPFNQLGFTAVRFCEFHENYTQQHQNVRTENGIKYGDLPEFVNYGYAAQVARMNLIGLSSIAWAPAMPMEVKMKVNLDNITHISWKEPASGPKPKGYYVLLRETIQPFWEKRIFVSEPKASLPYSKDNYFFAVQSVGENGFLSQIVMPTPTRD
ncbi:MAG: M20/M25/M40 family metallo-hydrolase [Flammeovirgaceae bacterium]|nr:M20/M25/M40 family metallo-hydrolase [Flammeovirgaceae bacterium]